MSDTTYDAIVVGSGFGGSVIAYRLARAGMRVCVLERGKEYPPGSFARTPRDMQRNLWEPRDGLQGLFDIWSFSGIDAVVASGVGGGSLIFSNVLERKPARWFHDLGEPWPVSYAALQSHYEAVEEVLAPQPYPYQHPPYARTARTQAMQDAARVVGGELRFPRLAVTFAGPDGRPVPGAPIGDQPGHNMYGVPRTTCRLCGECNLGCNSGSKHTLDLTYLSLAVAAGATIESRREVRRFRPLAGGDGYQVEYVVHEAEREGQKYKRSHLPVHTVTTRYLVLCAGALGTTFLLMRMRRECDEFRHLSPALGTRFSGNGDMLTLAIRTRSESGEGRLVPRRIDPTFGPVITASIRMSDALDRGEPERDDERGFFLEDAGYPPFIAWLTETAPTPRTLGRVLRLAWHYLRRRLGLGKSARLSGAVADLIGNASLTDTSLLLLAMGRDIPSGVMSLVGKSRLDVDWDLERSRPYVDRVRATSRRVATALRGEHIDNPLWSLRRLITVHPLGGAPMGSSALTGVVDSYGQVFGYPGLYVADGSIMPGAIGPNPALTIAALADRIGCKLAADWRARRR